MASMKPGWKRFVPGVAVSLACVSPLGLVLAMDRSDDVPATSGERADSRQPSAATDSLTAALAERASRLDRLHQMLLDAADERQGQAIAGQIWAVWLSHPDPRIDALMKDVVAAREEQRFDTAIELLDRLVSVAPDYAEGWNQRATIRYLLGDYEGSLLDIAETLAREPRHFGALSGRGMVRLQQGKQALAWQSFEAARQVHPWIASRSLVPPESRETQT